MTDLIKVHADLTGLAFPAMRQMMLHEADEHDLPVLANTDDHLMVSSEYGAFGLTARTEGVRLHIEADTDENLFILRDSLIEHIVYFVPDLADTIQWSDGPAAETLPLNFQFAKVLDCALHGEDFYRVTLKPEHTNSFGDTAIHFRFVLPGADNHNPVWPRVAPNGSVKWPTGDKALHRPVYTMRSVDPRSGTITVDVFRHDGGRATRWASAVAPGDHVAMIGPGGGGIPDTDAILLCGDETAYPAIARIIETLPAHCRGKAVLLNHSGRQDYQMPAHDGIDLHWVSPGDRLSLTDMALAAIDQLDQPYLWFAAESKLVAQFRASDAVSRVDKSRRYIATYWTQDEG